MVFTPNKRKKWISYQQELWMQVLPTGISGDMVICASAVLRYLLFFPGFDLPGHKATTEHADDSMRCRLEGAAAAN